jgi:translocator assembly and maintenance protein 41
MYVAGRLQKPCLFLSPSSSSVFQNAQKKNLLSALTLSLIFLPDKFTHEDLFLEIASLSYRGDFRMFIGGENPSKVRNIVNNQMDKFAELYEPFFNCELKKFLSSSNNIIHQDKSASSIKQYINNLPKYYKENVFFETRKKGIKNMDDLVSSPPTNLHSILQKGNIK